MEPTLRFGIALLKVLSWFLKPIFWMIFHGKVEKVLPIKNNILFVSGTKITEMIRKKEITCEEVIKAYIERVREVNPMLNAIVEERFSSSIEEAKEIDRYLNTTKIDPVVLKLEKPLLGLPITIKESCAVKGMSLCVGSKSREGIRAAEDGAAVKLLREAGAVVLLVSNTPEYSLYWESNNLVTGCTRNPYNKSRSPGGSSGGEGALLGSGASLIGIGTDIAGSIRLPAHCNGIFGHKPSPMTVPVEGIFPTSANPKHMQCLAIGPLTRYSEDLSLIMNVLDRNNYLKFNETIQIEDINIYHMNKFGNSTVITSVNKEIKSLIDSSVQHLYKNCGCKIFDYTFKMDDTLEMCADLLLNIEGVPSILKESGSNKRSDNLYLELVKSLFRFSKYSKHGLFISFIMAANGFMPGGKKEHYESLVGELKKDFCEKLGDSGVFLYPTFPLPAYYHNSFLIHFSGVLYLGIFNLLGFPSTHVPLGLNSEGLPIGIQIVAAPYNDNLCFSVAKELEKAFGGWTPP